MAGGQAGAAKVAKPKVGPPIALRTCYGKTGTDRGYAATQYDPKTHTADGYPLDDLVLFPPTVLRTQY
eukprot:177556-Rhodomonas_salina.2